MRTKKLVAAVLAVSMTASMLLSGSVFTASAESTLTFDIRSGGANEITVSAADIAAGDYTVPVDIYIPSNPGINGVCLKLQVNDGEVAEDGTFGNYGLYLTDAAYANPYCFDSAHAGNPQAAFAGTFNAENMNITWVYAQDTAKLADASAEADTTAWDNTADWAYTTAFAQANLVIPQNTAPGIYTLDIRTEEYLNALSQASGNPHYGRSQCSSAEGETSFESVPLTVTVEEAVTPEPWVDDYTIDTNDHYMIIGHVSAKPGETVNVPVYVYNDQGTSGMQLNFAYNNTVLTLNSLISPRQNYAYMAEPITNVEVYPAILAFAEAMIEYAENDSVLTYLSFTVPEDAPDHTTYPISFVDGESKLKVVGAVAEVALDVKMYDGSITVISDDATMLNFESFNTDTVGDTVNLTLFNATGEVTWTSSDESVATVDQNGFVVTTGEGTAVITVSNNGHEYTCTVNVGSYLYGDVDRNGIVDVNDAMLVLISATEYIANEKHTLDDEQLIIAEVSGDGEVDVVDAIHILRYYLEYEVAEKRDTTWRDITGNPNAPDKPQHTVIFYNGSPEG